MYEVKLTCTDLITKFQAVRGLRPPTKSRVSHSFIKRKPHRKVAKVAKVAFKVLFQREQGFSREPQREFDGDGTCGENTAEHRLDLPFWGISHVPTCADMCRRSTPVTPI